MKAAHSRKGCFCKSCEGRRRNEARFRERNREGLRQSYAEWRANNPERAREIGEAYRKRHPEKVAANYRKNASAYRARWPERQKASDRRYSKANPDKRAAFQRRRVARQRCAEGSHTAAEFRDVCERHGWACAYCGVDVSRRVTADHLIPLVRGGGDSIDNIVPSCRPCNSSKNARTPLEFFLGLPVPRKKPILHNNNEDNEKRYPAACFKRGMWTDEAEMHRVTREMVDG